jgi:putative lipoic acid-binding regulatory protein
LSEDQKRSLDLLEANHTFPGEFPLTVIALNSDAVTEAIVLSIEEVMEGQLAPDARETRLSSGGKYMSHRVRVPCAAATDVIRLYERVGRVDGVVTVL